MKVEIVLPWLDIGAKYSVLLFGTYYFFRKCVDEKRNTKHTVEAAFFSLAMGFAMIPLRTVIDPMHLALMLVYLTLTNCILFRDELSGKDSPSGQLKLSHIAVLSLLSFAICEALFMIVGFMASVVLSVLYYRIYTGEKSTYMDFLEDKPVHIVSYILSIFMVWVMIYLAAGMKRLRRGLMKMVERRTGGTGVMLAILLLTAVMVFAGAGHIESNSAIGMVLFVPMLILCVVMIYWAKWEIKAEYVRRVRKRNLLFMEGSLAEKDKETDSILADNERLAAVIRQDEELLRLLTDTAKEGGDAGTISQAAGELARLYSDRSGAVKRLESHGRTVSETGDHTLNAVLFYMSCLAENRGIDFDVDVKTDVGRLLGEGINPREFNTVLADLTENAIISVLSAGTTGAAKEKRVEVMLLNNEEHLCLEVLDSGADFDIEVLKKMGRQRITTHEGEGGSGIGLMTLFKFLGKTGASLSIEEFDGGEERRFNKSVGVIFDGKRRLRIITDRAEELKKALKSGRFEITRRMDPLKIEEE